MRNLAFFLPIALALALPGTAAVASKEERVQIWQYQDEEPLEAPSLDPSIRSVQWREGDLEVMFTQAAPCGTWIPANPVWTVDRLHVVLNFEWHPRYPDAPEPKKLCKKYVRAWVFRVPEGKYEVSFGSSVQRFRQFEDRILSLPSRN
ncbi:hypothetical protein [Rubrivivax gelatinosus]|uniref:hypothetical protein n=1 Tax=Rubrivivax gelatinosus TaxID=28068 RepID=UPI001907E32F|nr:hypothetical protein [Rubrivivax gelatinosus]